MKQALEIFCCVAESDRFFLEQLMTQLLPQQEQGLITLWNPSQIQRGSTLTTKEHLSNATIFLLLISSAFLADDYCYTIVLKTALERYQRGETLIVPVLIHPTPWQENEQLKQLQGLLQDRQAISNSANQKFALWEVTEEINAAIQMQERTEISLYSQPSPFLKLNPHFTPTSQAQMQQRTTPILVVLACILVVALVLMIPISHDLLSPHLEETSPMIHTVLSHSPTKAIHTDITPIDDPFKNTTSGNATSPSPAITPPAQASVSPSLIPAGKPVIDDPLKDNSGGYAWDVETTSHGNCTFVQGEYLLTAPAGTSNGLGCSTEDPKGAFSNFVYQIQMTILAGMDNGQSAAGLTFRINPSGNGQQYQVTFDAAGDWQISADAKVFANNSTECANPCPYFHKGLNQANMITILASGSTIKVQVNGYTLGSYIDSTYSSGLIGVQMDPGTSAGSVAFRNVRVWQI